MRASDFFRPGGALSQTPGYECRAGQARMADEVQDALENGGNLMVEAGTGIGKSWAYLLPALLGSGRVVVSTATKALQDQLFDKDLPFVQRILGIDVPVARLKGRRNYLCRRLWADYEAPPTLRAERRRDLKRFGKWASATETGDRDEIAAEIGEFDFFGALAAAPENCSGKECKLFEDCFLTKARARAEDARILVVNHALLVADLAVGGFVLPDYDTVVVDEAHRLEGAATSSFRLEITSSAAETLARSVKSFLNEAGKRPPAHLDRFVQSYRRLFDAIEPDDGDGKRVLEAKRLDSAVVRSRDACLAHLDDVNRIVAEDDREGLAGVAHEIGELSDALGNILAPRENRVVWCAFHRQQPGKERKRVSSLHSAPVHPGAELKEWLFSEMRAAVLTSATLAVDGEFGYAADQLGVESPATAIHPSPFDYGTNARLYVAPKMPNPNEANFGDAAARTVARLVAASRGRALVLFTSWKSLNQVAAILPRLVSQTVIRQRWGSGAAGLLDQFRTTPNAVLLGTRSFWEGVDVRGDALSLLVIDRLPFSVPDDPLQKARVDRVEAESGNGFMNYSVPEAALSLKQGLGRLIRSGTDRGLAAVLDSRLVTARYGKRIVGSLPDYPLITDEAEAVAFLKTL